MNRSCTAYSGLDCRGSSEGWRVAEGLRRRLRLQWQDQQGDRLKRELRENGKLFSSTVGPGISRAQHEDSDRTSDWGTSPSPPALDGDETLLSPVLIKVVGVGGGGGNAVDGMINTATRKLAGVEFIAMNTDTQALSKSSAEVRVALGSGVTRGLGAGGKPEVGQAAAEESLPEIQNALAGADMVFVTAGMGGGTGTGAAPVIAAAARELGCVTVAVVTEPFGFEGRQRSRQATTGVAALKGCADTVLVVENDRLLEIVPGRMTMSDAFLVADDVLRQGVIGTSEIIVRPGLINVDFADVREVVKNSGTALIGIGTGTGKTRAEDAAVGAICSPLLDFPLREARGVIFNIVGGLDLSLTEVNAAASIVKDNVHPDANIIVGALVDERCGKQISVTVLATGFGTPSQSSREAANLDGVGGMTAAAPDARTMGGREGDGRDDDVINPRSYGVRKGNRVGSAGVDGDNSRRRTWGIFRKLFRRQRLRD
ncbi:unnamed protein product [Ascophyllum nodosum]